MIDFRTINDILDKLKYYIPTFLADSSCEAKKTRQLLRAAIMQLENMEDIIRYKLRLQRYYSDYRKPCQFLDGSAYLNHVECVRKARGAEVPPEYYTDPLMYQAASDMFYKQYDDIPVYPIEYGLDYEVEIGVITTKVSMNPSYKEAEESIVGVVLINDLSLRGLIPNELKKGFGFVHGKPHSTLSDIMVPLEELGVSWKDNKFCAHLIVNYNGYESVLMPGKDMQFDFAQLIQHAAKTRPLSDGTLIGSGTISNRNSDNYGAIVEQRVTNNIMWDYMKEGDTIEINVAGFPQLHIKQIVRG